MPSESAAWGFSPQARSLQAEARLVEDDAEDDEEQDADVGGEVGLVHEGGAEEAHVLRAPVAEHGLFNHEPARGVAAGHLQGVLVGDDADKEEHQRGGQEVQGRAAYGLVGAQVYGGEAQKQREYRAHDRRGQHGQQLEALEGEVVVRCLGGFEELRLLHDVDEEHAYERAEYHNAFEREVDDTAALGEDAGERDYHQRDGVYEGLLNEECHFASPPFSRLSRPPRGASAGSAQPRAGRGRPWPFCAFCRRR